MKSRPFETVQGQVFVLLMMTFAAAHADPIDDRINQACTGLSKLFYNGGTKDDELDLEIARSIAGNRDVATLIKRAQLIGAASACGQETTAAASRLELQATSQFPNEPTKAKRFAHVLRCTQARFERFGIAAWAIPARCEQTKEFFDSHVVREQPIVPK